MLLYNNLVINIKSEKYQPFLINLISGRRRLLTDKEVILIKKIKAGFSNYETKKFVEKLINEKQFISKERLEEIERQIEKMGYWNKSIRYAKDYSFSIELTRFCNMNCSFCYAKNRETANSMSKKHIDAIYTFFQKYADDESKIRGTSIIRITGGEPLLNEKTASMIGYISEKWKYSKIVLFTNGVNVLKYYDMIPIRSLEEVHVSLDGPAAIHLSHRFSGKRSKPSVYDDIINGISRLLEDEVKVKVKTVLDRDTYLHFGDLISILEERGIYKSPFFEHLIGITLDYSNPFDIMEEVNDAKDIRKIEEHLRNKGCFCSTYPSLSILQKMMSRPDNKPLLPKYRRCNMDVLANYYFSCTGKIYLCDCIREDSGVVGTFYPKPELYESSIKALYDRNIFSNSKCSMCAYKYVCLGGCPHSANAKGKQMACGVFSDEEILDAIEFDYNKILLQRANMNETNK